MRDLSNRVAVVTGAASPRGIGRATALALAESGIVVAMADVQEDGVQQLIWRLAASSSWWTRQQHRGLRAREKAAPAGRGHAAAAGAVPRGADLHRIRCPRLREWHLAIATACAVRHLRGEAVPRLVELLVEIVDAGNAHAWNLPCEQRAIWMLEQARAARADSGSSHVA